MLSLEMVKETDEICHDIKINSGSAEPGFAMPLLIM